ncbi:J domain-containing protein [Methylolobus aquaticus]|nr:J domain-containing protein [Methylolobus aquaticus]
MMKIHTHYDNLQIARNASPSVIKAAYRALSQKWHPDKNPEQRERAEKVMRIINEAHKVLIDPAQRKKHDSWIFEQESAADQGPGSGSSSTDTSTHKRSDKDSADPADRYAKKNAGNEPYEASPEQPECLRKEIQKMRYDWHWSWEKIATHVNATAQATGTMTGWWTAHQIRAFALRGDTVHSSERTNREQDKRSNGFDSSHRNCDDGIRENEKKETSKESARPDDLSLVEIIRQMRCESSWSWERIAQHLNSNEYRRGSAHCAWTADAVRSFMLGQHASTSYAEPNKSKSKGASQPARDYVRPEKQNVTSGASSEGAKNFIFVFICIFYISFFTLRFLPIGENLKNEQSYTDRRTEPAIPRNTSTLDQTQQKERGAKHKRKEKEKKYAADVPISQPRPESGTIWTYNDKPDRLCPFTINAGSGADYLIKLVAHSAGVSDMFVYARSGSTVTVSVPAGIFSVRYASGNSWQGITQMFGQETVFSVATTPATGEIQRFEFVANENHVTGYTITLYAVPRGNLGTRKIDPSQF